MSDSAMTFATTDRTNAPLRVIQVGAGAMGRAWLNAITASDDVELVGVVDLDVALAEAALTTAGISGVAVGRSLTELLPSITADAVVNVTVPVAHLPVNLEAMRAGLPVLCEKPLAPTIAEAKLMTHVARETGQLLMASQSRRYYRSLGQLRDQVRSLGSIGAVSTQFFKAPRFGGFREQMAHVLLVDMAIHAFDTARYLIEREPIAVQCIETNPPWSWFADGANAVAVFEFDGGATYTYAGSWCAPGMETSWNGEWRVSGEHGTATWDGAGEPVVDRPAGEGAVRQDERRSHEPEEIAGALAEFVHALRTGQTPSGIVDRNVHTLAMVDAAIRSAETGRRVLIADVLAD